MEAIMFLYIIQYVHDALLLIFSININIANCMRQTTGVLTTAIRNYNLSLGEM